MTSPLKLVRHVALGNSDFTAFDNVSRASSISKNSSVPLVFDLFYRSFSCSDHNQPIATLVYVRLQFSDCVIIHSAFLDVWCVFVKLKTSFR